MLGDYPFVLAELAGHLPGPPPFKRLVVEGHTDSVGGAEYNQKLSLRRAEAIKRWLVAKHGLSAAKIEAVGYGKSRPIADNGNYQGRQQNRRVEFQIFR
jgi:OOP family OmpA-OmpF porin